MAPKGTTKKKLVEQELVTETKSKDEVQRTPSPYDPYKDLRYIPPPLPVLFKRKLKTTKIPVLKQKLGTLENKHRRSMPTTDILCNLEKSEASKTEYSTPVTLSSIFSGYKDKRTLNYMQLDSRAIVSRKLTPWVSDMETERMHLPKLALLPRPLSGETIRLLRQQRLDQESHSLAHYEWVKKSQLELENYLMRKVKKQRDMLLMRRDQVLPCIEPGGKEKCVDRRDVCQTPPPEKPPMLNIFAFHCKGNERRGLLATMSRRERGHNVITEWIGPPHVTDVIMRELGLLSTGSMELKFCGENQLSKGGLKEHPEQFVPALSALAVVGVAYKSPAERLSINNTPQRLFKPLALESSKGNYNPRHVNENWERSSNFEPRKTIAEMECSTEMGAVLYFGDHRLSWQGEHVFSASKSFIVEIGGTAEHGQSAVSSTAMRNAGTVVIRYSWVKCGHTDPFTLGRYRRIRFAFDNWGGVILPGETHRVPCLYKANDSGYFSEDWRLVTQPVLQGGEPIILRLWGITRHKASDLGRKEIEQHLQSLITKSVVTHRLKKIVDYLPLKEVPLCDTRFPLIHLGPDLFHLKNPYLHYNSASVFRLSKMVEMFQSINKPKSDSSCSDSDLSSSSSSASSNMSDQAFSEFEVIANAPYKSKDAVLPKNNKSPTKLISPADAIQPSIIKSVENISSKRRSYAETSTQPEDTINENIPELDVQSHSSDDLTHASIQTLVQKMKASSDLDHYVLEIPNMDFRLRESTSSDKSPYGSQGTKYDTRSEAQEKSPGHRAYVNVVDADVSVVALRKQIIDTHLLKVQEASFQIFTEEIAKLSFRPQLPKENWKQVVGFTHLCYVFDSFSEFAENLRVECCRGQLQEEIERRREEELLMLADINTVTSEDAFNDDYEIELGAEEKRVGENKANNASNAKLIEETSEKNALAEMTPEIENLDEEKLKEGGSRLSSSSNPGLDFFMDHCRKMAPRQILKKQRYQDNYYNRLYCRMYDLLGDFMDTVDNLWTAKIELKMDRENFGFTRIRDIHRGANIEDCLLTPLPPPWIRMAQKLDAVAASNKQRILLSKFMTGQPEYSGRH